MNGEHITWYVNSYHISGSGIETKQGVTYADGWSSWQSDQHGDGIVPVWSADLADRYPERTFYFTNEDGGVNHTSLAKNGEVLKFVNNLISGNTSSVGLDNIKPNCSVK